MSYSDQMWKDAKQKCRLNDADIAIAKRLGINPRNLIKNIPNKSEPWKASVKDWLRAMDEKAREKAEKKAKRNAKAAACAIAPEVSTVPETVPVVGRTAPEIAGYELDHNAVSVINDERGDLS